MDYYGLLLGLLKRVLGKAKEGSRACEVRGRTELLDFVETCLFLVGLREGGVKYIPLNSPTAGTKKEQDTA